MFNHFVFFFLSFLLSLNENRRIESDVLHTLIKNARDAVSNLACCGFIDSISYAYFLISPDKTENVFIVFVWYEEKKVKNFAFLKNRRRVKHF